jgi:hypothetical protein
MKFTEGLLRVRIYKVRSHKESGDGSKKGKKEQKRQKD